MIIIVDYGMGNLRSVQKAFEACGVKPKITSSAADIEKADKIVLPGVGSFGHAMQELKKRKLVAPLKEKIADGTPYLGLCLGMQLLFSSSEEGNVRGLDVLPGEVKRFSAKMRGGPAFGGQGHLKVPHMGWNTLDVRNKGGMLKGVKASDHFYFVHSYFVAPEEKGDVASTTDYGKAFCSSVLRGNIFATQFHPEKSQDAGLRIIRNFAT